MNARRYPWAALALLGVGTAAQFAYHFAPPQLAADVWNASLGAFLLVLLLLVANAYRSRLVLPACGLLGAWALLQAGCSLAYMVAPWVVLPGQAQCSARLDMPLTIIGAWLAGLAAANIRGAR